MTHRRRAIACLRAAGLLAVAAAGPIACRESLGPRGAALEAPAPRQLIVQLTVEPTESAAEFIVRGVARVGAGMEAPAAFRATVHLPAGVVVVGDEPGDAKMVTAMNVVGDAVRLAGATPEGDGSTELFALRVKAASVDLLDGATIVVHELANARGWDLRTALRVAARPARVSAP
jgi:hypothetical protein